MVPQFSNSQIDLARAQLVKTGIHRDLTDVLQSCDGKDLIGIIVPEMLERKNANLSKLSIESQCALIAGRSQITSPTQLESKFRKAQTDGRKLNVKFGVDATGRDLHLGHAVPMIMAGRLQRMGHQLQIIVGDFTARIGDPSGRANTRAPLSEDKIRENVTKYTEQFALLFDVSTAHISYNSDWLNKMTLADGFRLFSQMSLSSAIQREDFRERIKTGLPVSQAEILYANLMGVDSVQLNADIELGGVDQTLNFHVCRTMMELHGLEPEVLITSPIIPGISGNGQKMSKSLNNYISLLESEHEVFGKIMSIPDSLMEVYFKSLTEIHDAEWSILAERISKNSLNPRDVKAAIAATITAFIRGEAAAIDASQAFANRFSARVYSLNNATCALEIENNAQTVASIIKASNLFRSSSEVRRLIEGGAVSAYSQDGEFLLKFRNNSDNLSGFKFPLLLKVGKLHLLKVEIKDPSN